MSGASDTRKVELVAGVDITTLPLEPMEGFVLSRIQGRTKVSDVLALCGLPAEQVEAILSKLVRCGAVRVLDDSAGPSSAATPGPAARPTSSQRVMPVKGASPPPGRRTSSTHHRAVIGGTRRGSRPMMSESPISGSPPPRSSIPPGRRGSSRDSLPSIPGQSPRATPPQAASEGASRLRVPTPPPAQSAPSPKEASPPPAPEERLPYDPAELEEAVDLPLERRKQVLAMYYRMAEFDHYQALGVASGASRKEIRSAYFALSKAFHPDTMFRKQLGSFKAKMEIVFKRITEAYDTLSRKRSRADYDAYLRATQATRATEEVLERAAQVERAVGASVDVADDVGGSGTQPPAEHARGSGPVPVPSARTERGKDVARQAISRRLVQASRSMPAVRISPSDAARAAASSAPPQEDSSRDSRRDALRGLATQLRQSGDASGDTQGVALQIEAARRAEAEGQLARAQQLLRRALSQAPEREELRREHARLSGLLSRQLADDYEAQAELEEKQGQWASAALSWSKVHEGRDQDPRAACRVAVALLQYGGDVRRAHEYAQKAVLAAPDEALHRVTLAKVMLNIGLLKGAKRELEAAQRLDPQSEIVKNLLAELKG